MLFSANHGITDSLSFICCIDHEPNTDKHIAEAVVVLHGRTLEPDPVCLRGEHPSFAEDC